MGRKPDAPADAEITDLGMAGARAWVTLWRRWWWAIVLSNVVAAVIREVVRP